MPLPKHIRQSTITTLREEIAAYNSSQNSRAPRLIEHYLPPLVKYIQAKVEEADPNSIFGISFLIPSFVARILPPDIKGGPTEIADAFRFLEYHDCGHFRIYKQGSVNIWLTSIIVREGQQDDLRKGWGAKDWKPYVAHISSFCPPPPPRKSKLSSVATNTPPPEPFHRPYAKRTLEEKLAWFNHPAQVAKRKKRASKQRAKASSYMNRAKRRAQHPYFPRPNRKPFVESQQSQRPPSTPKAPYPIQPPKGFDLEKDTAKWKAKLNIISKQQKGEPVPTELYTKMNAAHTTIPQSSNTAKKLPKFTPVQLRTLPLISTFPEQTVVRYKHRVWSYRNAPLHPITGRPCPVIQDATIKALIIRGHLTRLHEFLAPWKDSYKLVVQEPKESC